MISDRIDRLKNHRATLHVNWDRIGFQQDDSFLKQFVVNFFHFLSAKSVTHH